MFRYMHIWMYVCVYTTCMYIYTYCKYIHVNNAMYMYRTTSSLNIGLALLTNGFTFVE